MFKRIDYLTIKTDDAAGGAGGAGGGRPGGANRSPGGGRPQGLRAAGGWSARRQHRLGRHSLHPRRAHRSSAALQIGGSMITISKTIQTKASPARVLNFFNEFAEHFVEIWPEAHQEYEITSDGPVGVGTTFRTVQTIKGKKMSSRGVGTKAEPGGFAWGGI